MKHDLRILMVEDVPADAELAVREMKRAGLGVVARRVDREQDLRRELEEFRPVVILSDFNMPQFDGMAALAIARELAPEIPFIFVSGTLGEDYAIRALKNGAHDYVLKSNLVRLPPTVERAVAEAKARADRRREDQLLALEHSIVRHIAGAESAASGLDAIMRAICESEGWEICRFFLVDEKAGILRFERAWCVSGGPREFIELSRDQTFQRGEGLAGRAWESNAPVWSEDTSTDPRVHHTALSRTYGLGGAFIMPVSFGGRIIGTLGFSGRRIRAPDERLLRTTGVIGAQIGQFLERQEQQRHLARLNRLYAVLSGINSAIVRTRERDALLREACRIAVEAGGFRMAWIGIADQASGQVRVVASQGADAKYLAAMPLGLRAEESNTFGLAGRALLERGPMIADDMTTDPRVTLRPQARDQGFRSLAMLPVLTNDAPNAVLCLYSEAPNLFREEGEMRLLEDLAGDIAFALDHLAKSERIEFMAYFDATTGLPNATLFRDRLARYVNAALETREKLAVGVLDIDGFKNINDSLGRQAGDDLLRQFAERMRRGATNPDSVARIGGNQFAFVRQHIHEEEEMARHHRAKYAELLEGPFHLGGTELRVSARAGLALFPADGGDADALFRNAEAALKKAKERNERYLFYAEEMTARVTERLALENELRHATKRQEFVLHYQPKVDTETRAIVGVEALIRWQSPSRGLVPPLHFIPLLEQTGLILEVGAWALEQAARDHQEWEKQGLAAPRIAVNVSAIQLRRPDFVATVEHVLRLGATPHGLDLEITESLLMEEITANIEKLKVLRELGVGVAIDDFGTGYSSLGYLTKLPVQSLKIDRSFIVAMVKEPDTMSLVSTIITLGRALRLKLVAEGVDSDEQAKVLRLLRCDEMQGYLVSKPVPRDQIAAMLRTANPAPAMS